MAVSVPGTPIDQHANVVGCLATLVQHLTECDDMRQGCALRRGSG